MSKFNEAGYVKLECVFNIMKDCICSDCGEKDGCLCQSVTDFLRHDWPCLDGALDAIRAVEDIHNRNK